MHCINSIIMDINVIQHGDYVIIQRQGYTKLHKIKENGSLMLGNFFVELGNAVGEKYETTYQMKLKPGTKKAYLLEKVSQLTTVSQISVETSGLDNRNITDDGSSQTLTKDEIMKLRDESSNSADMVGHLISNSKTFTSKTEYSQEKYMKKKEKKYFEYVQIRKPTLRLLVQMYNRQDPSKTLGIRIDDLSQILTYANIQSDGNFLLYDSGSSGLITAAILNGIGKSTTGSLIHAHPGNECQKNAVQALQLPQELLERCINVNLYSVLRCYYQNKESYSHDLEKALNDVDATTDVSATSDVVEDQEKTTSLDESSITVTSSDDKVKSSSRKRKLNDNGSNIQPKKLCWQRDNERACRILQNKMDGLIVVSKEHPVNIVKALIEFLDASRSLVVFNTLREPLQELYTYLKSRTDIISLKLSSNFMRHYQILPDRTHPEVNMTNGGYILTGFKLSC